LMSLSLYALVALRRDHAVATEAAMKYFVLGALASGFLLYGMSMLYGATRSLDLSEVFEAIHTGQINATVLTFGVVFIVAGLGFKLGVVPFHMWVPDVYQGAPTAVTLLIAGAPKLADAAAWGPRVKSGADALLASALKGKGAMGAQGGGDFSDYEIARAVVFMANQGGAKFDEPKAPAAPASEAQ